MKRVLLIILSIVITVVICWLIVSNWYNIIAIFKRDGSADNIVVDPESGQYVLNDELTILASDEDIEGIVMEFDGKIVTHVRETDTYQVKFPVKNLRELKKIRIALESKGLIVYYSFVLMR
jgi:hypothetical protein